MSFEGPGKLQAAPWQGARIAALRNELHLTQPEMAKRMHVRLKTLQTWEGGRGRATAWAVPRLDRMERKIGKSQALMMARKKGIVPGEGQDRAFMDVPPRKPGPRTMAVGSTTGRMVGARIRTLKANIKAKRQPQETLEDHVAAARVQALSHAIRNQKKGAQAPANQAADARVQYLRHSLKNQKAAQNVSANTVANTRLQLLRRSLKNQNAVSNGSANPAADARVEYLKRMLKSSTKVANAPIPINRAADARQKYLGKMLKLEKMAA